MQNSKGRDDSIPKLAYTPAEAGAAPLLQLPKAGNTFASSPKVSDDLPNGSGRQLNQRRKKGVVYIGGDKAYQRYKQLAIQQHEIERGLQHRLAMEHHLG
jgi:hypothetical protein